MLIVLTVGHTHISSFLALPLRWADQPADITSEVSLISLLHLNAPLEHLSGRPISRVDKQLNLLFSLFFWFAGRATHS